MISLSITLSRHSHEIKMSQHTMTHRLKTINPFVLGGNGKSVGQFFIFWRKHRFWCFVKILENLNRNFGSLKMGRLRWRIICDSWWRQIFWKEEMKFQETLYTGNIMHSPRNIPGPSFPCLKITIIFASKLVTPLANSATWQQLGPPRGRDIHQWWFGKIPKESS